MPRRNTMDYRCIMLVHLEVDNMTWGSISKGGHFLKRKFFKGWWAVAILARKRDGLPFFN
jgi:hypothetical protein